METGYTYPTRVGSYALRLTEESNREKNICSCGEGENESAGKDERYR